MSYEEEMPGDYPEPTPPEETISESDTSMTPEPDLSLEQFMDLSEAEQAAIWSQLMSTTQETKADTTRILELVKPQDVSEDALKPLIEEMIEISMRVEDNQDLEAAKSAFRFDYLKTSMTNLHKKMGAELQQQGVDLSTVTTKEYPKLEDYLKKTE